MLKSFYRWFLCFIVLGRGIWGYVYIVGFRSGRRGVGLFGKVMCRE